MAIRKRQIAIVQAMYCWDYNKAKRFVHKAKRTVEGKALLATITGYYH